MQNINLIIENACNKHDVKLNERQSAVIVRYINGNPHLDAVREVNSLVKTAKELHRPNGDKHIDTLNLSLSHERERLAKAKTDSEKEMRRVWATQIEKEVIIEEMRLGIKGVEECAILSDDDLLKELGE